MLSPHGESGGLSNQRRKPKGYGKGGAYSVQADPDGWPSGGPVEFGGASDVSSAVSTPGPAASLTAPSIWTLRLGQTKKMTPFAKAKNQLAVAFTLSRVGLANRSEAMADE